MSATKLSIALEEQVARAARQSAERKGMSLSAWVNEASRNALRIEEGLAAVAEWEAEHGPISVEERTKAKALLDTAGVGRP